MSEEGAHDGRILDGGHDAQPAATAGTGERAVHQRRPDPDVGGAGGAGLAHGSGGVWGWEAVADDLERRRAREARTPW